MTEQPRSAPAGRDSASAGLDSASAGLDVAVDRDAEVPIGVQLAWALRTRIRDGRFKPGQRLPGLRDLAEATRINVNTVRSVYQRLEQEGLIDSQQGSGTFVAPTPQPPSAAATIAADAAREAAATGVDLREVAAALYVAPDSSAQRRSDSERAAAKHPQAAARRRALRTQIATLERAISEIEAEHPGLAPQQPALTRNPPGPALLDADELERVRSQLVRRLGAVQAAIDEHAAEPSTAAEQSTAKATRSAPAKAKARPRRKPAPKPSAEPAPAAKRPARTPSAGRPAAAGT